mgnify:CR=1 FL=1
MHRVLFLCMGNICRSPAAHCVFHHAVEKADRSGDFEIDSAGTIGFHAGEPPDARMRAAMEKRGIPVFGSARQLEQSDLAHYDLILAMDPDNLRHARGLDTSGRHADKLRLFCDYCTRHDAAAVPDPYYGGDGGFSHVLDLIEDGCEGLLRELR